MKARTREQVIATLEKTIEKKGSHIQSMLFISKEIQKIKDEVIEQDLKDESIECYELLSKMDRLKLQAIDIKIDTLKEILLKDEI